MARNFTWFFAFLVFNLVALYLPSMFCILFLPGPMGFGTKLLVSPVALLLLIVNPHSIGAWVAMLAPYAIVVPGLSLLVLCRYRWVACLGPCVLFAFGLAQGFLFLALMHMDWLGEC